MTDHTPGPWMLAAKPSSVVGWPIVACGHSASAGRVICSLNYADPKAFGGKMPGDGAFNRESEANGQAIAAVPEMLAALLWIDGEAPTTSSGLAVGFQPSQDPEQDDGNDTVREAFQEGVAHGLWLAAEKARAAIARATPTAEGVA